MKKNVRSTKRVTGTTKGVMVRLKKTTIRWLETKIDEDHPSVPARARKIIEDHREADEKKSSG